MNKPFLILLIALIVFSGCNMRKYFKPAKHQIKGEAYFPNHLQESIVSSNRYGAILKNGAVIGDKGLTQLRIGKNFNYESSFLNESQGFFILAQDCLNKIDKKTSKSKVAKTEETELKLKGVEAEVQDKVCHQVELISSNPNASQQSIIIPLETFALSASVKGNLLAVVLADNSANLYDITSQKLLFSEKGSPSTTINSLMAMPIFMDTVVVFPMLDGRLLVVDYVHGNPTPIRNIVISSDKFFNNITYLIVDGNNMIASTGKRILSVVSGQEFNYDGDIVDLLYDKGTLYVLTLDGQILQMDKSLRELNSVKLPFASLNTIVLNHNKLYSLEKRGYVIEVDLNDFNSYNVYKTPTIGSFKFFSSNRLDKGVFYDKNRVYYDRYYLDYNNFKPKLYPVVEKPASEKSQKGEKGNAPIYLQERHKAKEKPLEENKVKPRNSGFEEDEVKANQRGMEPINNQNNANNENKVGNENNAIQQGENKNAPVSKENNQKGTENAPVSKEDNAFKEAPKLSPKEEKRRLKEEKKKAKAEQRAREFEQRAREQQERDEKELEERKKALEMNKK
ncbi:plasminogen-binding protein pgbA C-terminal domain-containing protein [Helicobacter pylori]|uniref:plasminogen-binding protein PgbB n=1 Tax=Helicobacter pylori TaxID=210 RepID=UPI001922159F|nr:plasminogen-binding protein pgbA C-terminal domain-containing protein [Helicobacter pylori]QQW67691.1 plasmid stabilization protein [Helicobacter pylori]QQW95231.1 plasmid stabilization protein [Helicobacter pylori]QQW96629.1 plasmid stabilization protein [Helicobacter pylori]QQW98114.1 plasmid stabilization protein [Helicobacter pylori]